LLDTARVLDEYGSLGASEQRKQLYDRNPGAYNSAKALWASTAERLDDDLLGFDYPEYGSYTFDRAAAMECLAASSD